MNLLSSPSFVESPYIKVKIGDYTFGAYKGSRNKVASKVNPIQVDYPNFMESINIVKINGAVNTYTINMVYIVTHEDDPNLLEKVFSSVSQSRKIWISYGDCSAPSFIFKEESAIITKITTGVDVAGSKLTYTLECVSDAITLNSDVRDFTAKTAKPSDEIRRLLRDKSTGLLKIFPGMSNLTVVNQDGLIASDDKPVELEQKMGTSVMDYLVYLVNCMIPESDYKDSIQIHTAKYYMKIEDDIKNKYNGAYFKVVKVDTVLTSIDSFDTYELDIGYADISKKDSNFITNFQVRNDDTYSVLYNYSGKVGNSNYIYRLDDEGKLVTTYSPTLTRSKRLFEPLAQSEAWWTEVTRFPIGATVTIKGLLRPSMLMTYIRVNVWFYGAKHISSGLYVITKQEDSISAGNGYRTTLTLQKILGDTDTV